MPSAKATDSFEHALAELERIVTSMESRELPLEEALQNYQRGLTLLQQCRARLESAEQRIAVLEKGELTDYADSDAASSASNSVSKTASKSTTK